MFLDFLGDKVLCTGKTLTYFCGTVQESRPEALLQRMPTLQVNTVATVCRPV